MSGHSKWATTKHRKSAVDAKKGKAFSKIAKLISVAARDGADPEMNFSLRLMVDKAKAVNMPKENIERAIARGAGTGDGGELTSAVYEGMAPGGVSVLVEVLTDNTNRAYTNIRTIFNKHGGNMDAKVMWQFNKMGVVHTSYLSSSGLTGGFSDNKSRSDIELALIDAGADNIDWDDESGLTIASSVQNLKKISDSARASGLEISSADLQYIPNTTIELSDEDGERLMKFIDILEEDDDVDNVYTNVA